MTLSVQDLLAIFGVALLANVITLAAISIFMELTDKIDYSSWG